MPASVVTRSDAPERAPAVVGRGCNAAPAAGVGAALTTLTARIEAAASRATAVTFVGSGAPDRVPWAELHAEARGMAGALQARGVAPGDHVAILGPTSRPLVTAIQAAWLCGA